jgi:hypothetical protein
MSLDFLALRRLNAPSEFMLRVPPGPVEGQAVRVAITQRRCPSSGSAREPHDERNDEQDQEHPEQKLCGINGDTRDAAEPEGCRNQGYDQEHDGIMKKIAHDDLQGIGLTFHATATSTPRRFGRFPTGSSAGPSATLGSLARCPAQTPVQFQ